MRVGGEDAFIAELMAFIDRYIWGEFTGSIQAHFQNGQLENVDVRQTHRRRYGRGGDPPAPRGGPGHEGRA